jgi:hypothetical protein
VSDPLDPEPILPETFELFAVGKGLDANTFLKTNFPLSRVLDSIRPIKLAVSVRHIIAEGAFVVGAIREGMSSKDSLVFLEGALEELAIFVLDKSLTVKQACLKLPFINELIIYKLPLSFIPITHKRADILSLFVLKLLLAQSMFQIIPPLSRICLIKVLVVPLTMRKPILNVPFIVTRWLDQPSVP